MNDLCVPVIKQKYCLEKNVIYNYGIYYLWDAGGT